ncbi:MAG TPA: thioesterase family protein [Acidobacteriota bacterium]|nr:thioesterase family protein [Acidobacteriota bacterium]
MVTFGTSVRLHDTDAAGLLFFGHQFTIAHDAYETFMEQIGCGFARIIREEDFLLPIVHAEADYRAELFVGDRLTVRLTVEDVGDTSFTLAYDLLGDDGKSAGTVRTVHVCMDKAGRKKKPLPDGLRRALTAHL